VSAYLALAFDAVVEHARDLIGPLLERPVERSLEVDWRVKHCFDSESLEPSAELRPGSEWCVFSTRE
jgi:hypothetical protein